MLWRVWRYLPVMRSVKQINKVDYPDEAVCGVRQVDDPKMRFCSTAPHTSASPKPACASPGRGAKGTNSSLWPKCPRVGNSSLPCSHRQIHARLCLGPRSTWPRVAAVSAVIGRTTESMMPSQRPGLGAGPPSSGLLPGGRENCSLFNLFATSRTYVLLVGR
jgi:hypothetical protein